LESLGWRFHRIWSTDWFRDPQKELARTTAAIESARLALQQDQPAELTIRPVRAPLIHRDALEAGGFAATTMTYRKFILPSSLSSGYPLHETPLEHLALLVKSVVEIEAPLHEAEVTRRLMASFGVSRAGVRIVERVALALSHGHRAELFQQADGFIYADKERSATVRNRSALASSERRIEWVAPEEIEVALLAVVRMGFSLSPDAAVSAALDSLGFGRATANIAHTVGLRIEGLLNTGQLVLFDEKLVVGQSAGPIK
jgi:hypothetical protein